MLRASVGARAGQLGCRGVELAQSTRRCLVAFARVVSFDEVSEERIEELKREIGKGERPEGIPATEVVLLHDPDAKTSQVIIFFETENDYKLADETLNAMSPDETHGRRTSVTKYNVAARMTA